MPIVIKIFAGRLLLVLEAIFVSCGGEAETLTFALWLLSPNTLEGKALIFETTAVGFGVGVLVGLGVGVGVAALGMGVGVFVGTPVGVGVAVGSGSLICISRTFEDQFTEVERLPFEEK